MPPFALRVCISVFLACSVCYSQTETKVIALDGAPNDQFGSSIDLHGETLIFGANWADIGIQNVGAAYIFNAQSGTPGPKLIPQDIEPGLFFGYSVSTNGTLSLVGAPFDSDQGYHSGSAYLFNSESGRQTAKLLANDGSNDYKFGWAVAISENLVLVGAPGWGAQGSAYLFDATTGLQLSQLLPSDGESDDNFGCSVDIDGDLVIVGANGDDDNGSVSGSAYIFDVSNPTSPVQTFKLVPSNGTSFDEFGLAVGVGSGLAVVGARFSDQVSLDGGAAYVFDASNGLELSNLTPRNLGNDDGFGCAVAISSALIAVGALQDNGAGAGQTYLFNATDRSQITTLEASDGLPNDRFGCAIAIDQGIVAVGANLDDTLNGTDSGSAYILDLSSCETHSYCIASPNTVSATGAPISLDGLPSLSGNNMTLRADNLRPNQFGVFFYGPVKQDPPVSFGDGYRCVGTFDLKRLNPPVATGTGTAQRALDMTAMPLNSVQAGDTRYFQFWYRDPGVIGAGYNLTDGLEITFCP